MQLLKSSKDFQLDKDTFVNLRWIAHVGQFLAIVIVKFILNFQFPEYLYCFVIVGLGILTNLYLQFKTKENQLDNFQSTIYLGYDIIQLGVLIYLTGGITNPFVFLLIIPSVFSSKYLSLWSSILLAFLTVFILILITFYYIELPHPLNSHFSVPEYYFYSIPLSVIIGLIFLVYFGLKFGKEYRIRKEALENIQKEMAKEHEIVSLGGQAAAAAHSLGTPLSTISLIVNELKDELGKNPKYSEDINLLISQSNRCNEILKKLSLNPHVEDEFIENETNLNDHLNEIIRSFEEISEKEFILNNKDYKTSTKMNRSIEVNYGLRNFIGNAAKFSKKKIEINLKSDHKITEIIIKDDGPGFPIDLIGKLGEPYIHSNKLEKDPKIGLGLGTFIGKNLLEKNFAEVKFENLNDNKGASVTISWLNENLKKI